MAAQHVLTNVNLLEIILSSLLITTLTTVRRVARSWREAVDNSPTNSELQMKQFYTAITARKMVKTTPSSLGLIGVLSVTSIINMLATVEHYLLIDVHPAFDPYRERSLSVVNFGFAIPLKYVLNMQNSSFERAFVTQPPIAKVLALQHDYMPACFRKVKIVAESGVTFGDIIKAIIPLAKDEMKQHHIKLNSEPTGGPLSEAVTSEHWVKSVVLHFVCPEAVPSKFGSLFKAVS